MVPVFFALVFAIMNLRSGLGTAVIYAASRHLGAISSHLRASDSTLAIPRLKMRSILLSYCYNCQLQYTCICAYGLIVTVVEAAKRFATSCSRAVQGLKQPELVWITKLQASSR